MLAQWKRDKAACDREMAALRAQIKALEREGWRSVSARIELRVLLNKIACHRIALNQRIIQQETDDELTRLVAGMTDMPFTHAAKLKRDMELNRNAPLSPLIL